MLSITGEGVARVDLQDSQRDVARCGGEGKREVTGPAAACSTPAVVEKTRSWHSSRMTLVVWSKPCVRRVPVSVRRRRRRSRRGEGTCPCVWRGIGRRHMQPSPVWWVLGTRRRGGRRCDQIWHRRGVRWGARLSRHLEQADDIPSVVGDDLDHLVDERLEHCRHVGKNLKTTAWPAARAAALRARSTGGKEKRAAPHSRYKGHSARCRGAQPW